MRKYIITMLNSKEEKEVHTVLEYTVRGAIKRAHEIYGPLDVVDVIDLAE